MQYTIHNAQYTICDAQYTIARYENTNAVGIGAKILSIRNVGLAALDLVTGTPTMKAKLAIAIKNAGTIAGKNMGRGAMVAGRHHNENKTEILEGDGEFIPSRQGEQ